MALSVVHIKLCNTNTTARVVYCQLHSSHNQLQLTSSFRSRRVDYGHREREREHRATSNVMWLWWGLCTLRKTFKLNFILTTNERKWGKWRAANTRKRKEKTIREWHLSSSSSSLLCRSGYFVPNENFSFFVPPEGSNFLNVCDKKLC